MKKWHQRRESPQSKNPDDRGPNYQGPDYRGSNLKTTGTYSWSDMLNVCN